MFSLQVFLRQILIKKQIFRIIDISIAIGAGKPMLSLLQCVLFSRPRIQPHINVMGIWHAHFFDLVDFFGITERNPGNSDQQQQSKNKEDALITEGIEKVRDP